jgi:hypothetical protein
MNNYLFLFQPEQTYLAVKLLRYYLG